MTLESRTHNLLARLGVPASAYAGGELAVTSPLTGGVIAQVKVSSVEGASSEIAKAKVAFKQWRLIFAILPLVYLVSSMG